MERTCSSTERSQVSNANTVLPNKWLQRLRNTWSVARGAHTKRKIPSCPTRMPLADVKPQLREGCNPSHIDFVYFAYVKEGPESKRKKNLHPRTANNAHQKSALNENPQQTKHILFFSCSYWPKKLFALRRNTSTCCSRERTFLHTARCSPTQYQRYQARKQRKQQGPSNNLPGRIQQIPGKRTCIHTQNS